MVYMLCKENKMQSKSVTYAKIKPILFTLKSIQNFKKVAYPTGWCLPISYIFDKVWYESKRGLK